MLLLPVYIIVYEDSLKKKKKKSKIWQNYIFDLKKKLQTEDVFSPEWVKNISEYIFELFKCYYWKQNKWSITINCMI